jgi:hypothetical protein
MLLEPLDSKKAVEPQQTHGKSFPFELPWLTFSFHITALAAGGEFSIIYFFSLSLARLKSSEGEKNSTACFYLVAGEKISRRKATKQVEGKFYGIKWH